MAKNIIKKITLILLTIIVGFLINNKEVKAASSCAWGSPLSFLDEGNNATNLQLKLTYQHAFQNNYLFVKFNNWTLYTEYLQIDKFLASTTSDNDKIKFGYHINPSFSDTTDKMAVSNQDTFYYCAPTKGNNYNCVMYYEGFTNKYADGISVSNTFDNCPKYIRIYASDGKIKVEKSDESKYEEYVKNQYKNLSKDSTGSLYNIINIDYAYSAEKDTSTIPGFSDANDAYYNYVKTIGGIVLVDTSSAPSYPTTALNKYKEMLGYYKKDGKKLTEDQKKEALEGLNTIIGTSSTDDKTYTDKFYEATKDRWYNYMKADLENPKKAAATRKTYFSKWWDLVARYEFEADYANKDMTRFKKFVNYMCENNLVDNYDATKCENIIGIVDSMINYDKADAQQTNLADNSCNALCNSCIQTSSAYNGTACNECSKGVDYKTCTSCIRNCKNVQSSSSRTDCEKGCMGEELYNTYISEYNEVKDELEQQKQDAAQDAYESSVTLYSLYSVRAPSLDIKFGKEGYKVNCDDIPELHTYYMIIIILAPILVILFGSIDFAKAVIASDEKKMQEFKSKFPKRLGLLVVLIIVPLIIRLILGVTDLNMDLMECVIKGYN